MKNLSVVAIAAVLLSGCSTPLFFNPDGVVKDISTSEVTAQISPRNCCYCMFHYPAKGHVITVDAGRQFFVQKCTPPPSGLHELSGGVMGTGRQTYFRTFYFDAVVDQEYRLNGNCFRLAYDHVPDEDQVVGCAPRLRGRLALSSFENSATIIPGGTTSRVDACWPTVGVAWDESNRQLVVGVDDGLTIIDASCDLPDPYSTSVKTASFKFHAEAGHAYTLSGEDEECMRLVDITAEETIIACEPYHDEAME